MEFFFPRRRRAEKEGLHIAAKWIHSCLHMAMFGEREKNEAAAPRRTLDIFKFYLINKVYFLTIMAHKGLQEITFRLPVGVKPKQQFLLKRSFT